MIWYDVIWYDMIWYLKCKIMFAIFVTSGNCQSQFRLCQLARASLQHWRWAMHIANFVGVQGEERLGAKNMPDIWGRGDWADKILKFLFVEICNFPHVAWIIEPINGQLQSLCISHCACLESPKEMAFSYITQFLEFPRKWWYFFQCHLTHITSRVSTNQWTLSTTAWGLERFLPSKTRIDRFEQRCCRGWGSLDVFSVGQERRHLVVPTWKNWCFFRFRAYDSLDDFFREDFGCHAF